MMMEWLDRISFVSMILLAVIGWSWLMCRAMSWFIARRSKRESAPSSTHTPPASSTTGGPVKAETLTGETLKAGPGQVPGPVRGAPVRKVHDGTVVRFDPAEHETAKAIVNHCREILTSVHLRHVGAEGYHEDPDGFCVKVDAHFRAVAERVVGNRREPVNTETAWRIFEATIADAAEMLDVPLVNFKELK